MVSDDKKRPLFMISVAAELAEMHPQTLRMYERKGLIKPSRSSRSTRLYSMEDVERLQNIQRLTSVAGLNLAGVERVLDLEYRMTELLQRIEALEEELADAVEAAQRELDEAHRSYRKELVPMPGREIVLRTTYRRETRAR